MGSKTGESGTGSLKEWKQEYNENSDVKRNLRRETGSQYWSRYWRSNWRSIAQGPHCPNETCLSCGKVNLPHGWDLVASATHFQRPTVCMYVHACMHLYICMCVCACVHTDVHTCIHIRVHTHVCVCAVYTCMCALSYACVCVHVRLCVPVHVLKLGLWSDVLDLRVSWLSWELLVESSYCSLRNSKPEALTHQVSMGPGWLGFGAAPTSGH